MHYRGLLVVLFIGILLTGFAKRIYALAEPGDRIIGSWEVNENGTIADIYKDNGKYYAKISKVKPENKNLKTGVIVLRDFKFENKTGKWVNGQVYAPKKKREISAELKLLNEDTLEIHAKEGIFSKTITWKRRKEG